MRIRVASLLAVLVFAATIEASADATVDLLWGGLSPNVWIGADASSSTLVLDVVITAGSSGVEFFGITVDYQPVVAGAGTSVFANHAPVPPFFPLTNDLAIHLEPSE